jgi:hypothetical protein
MIGPTVARTCSSAPTAATDSADVVDTGNAGLTWLLIDKATLVRPLIKRTWLLNLETIPKQRSEVIKNTWETATRLTQDLLEGDLLKGACSFRWRQLF